MTTRAELAPYTRTRIEAIAERALAESGALGRLPTPLGAVADYARIRGVEPVAALPDGLRTRGTALLGALWFEERLVYVDPRQSAPRRRFTEAHELVHALCPWHHAVLREDTEAELFKAAVDAVEAEANAGAGALIFQASAFRERAAGVPVSIGPVLELASAHGASQHATLHHFAQTHPDAVALVTAGRFPRRDGSLPVWGSVESSAFRRRCGPAHAYFPDGLRRGEALHALAEAARVAGGAAGVTVLLDGRGVDAEALYNRHAFLILLRARRRPRSARGSPGRRTQPAAPAGSVASGGSG